MNEKLKIDLHIVFPFLVTLLLWVIFYFDVSRGLALQEYGVWPRSVKGLPGIIAHFFIHGSFAHILSNTISFLVLSLFLFTGYRAIAFKVFAWMIPFTGALLWLIGRSTENGARVVHIGASGLIFSLFGFLLLSGLVRKNKRMMSLTALVIFLYGYMVWGIFPLEKQVSWDGHLAGLISGCVLAWLYRKKGPQPDKYTLLEEEEEDEYDKLPEAEKYWMHDNQDLPEHKPPQPQGGQDPFPGNLGGTQVIINYHYLPENKKDGEEQNKDKDI